VSRSEEQLSSIKNFVIYNLQGRVQFSEQINVLGLVLEDLATIEKHKIEINSEVCLDRYGMDKYIRLSYYGFQPKGASMQERSSNAHKLAHLKGADLLRYDDEKRVLILGTSSNNLFCTLISSENITPANPRAF
jgi:hypothetical protein